MCLVSFANGAAFFAHGVKNHCAVQTELNTYVLEFKISKVIPNRT